MFSDHRPNEASNALSRMCIYGCVFECACSHVTTRKPPSDYEFNIAHADKEQQHSMGQLETTA